MSLLSRRVASAATTTTTSGPAVAGRQALTRSCTRTRPPSSKRFASDHAHDAHSHGSGESALHVQGGSGNESFGKGFYVALTAIPFAYIAYSVSFSEDNFIKRSYRNYHADAKAQDVLHAAALEQAISDRASVFSEPRIATREMRYPEFFNHGSPNNVSAGQGTADLTKLQAYYEQKRKEIDEERAAKNAARNPSPS